MALSASSSTFCGSALGTCGQEGAARRYRDAPWRLLPERGLQPSTPCARSFPCDNHCSCSPVGKLRSRELIPEQDGAWAGHLLLRALSARQVNSLAWGIFFLLLWDQNHPVTLGYGMNHLKGGFVSSCQPSSYHKTPHQITTSARQLSTMQLIGQHGRQTP